MAVPNIPFYLSQANQEFLGTPTGNASVTMNTAGVAVPGLVSQLAGLSSGVAKYTLTVGYASGSEDYNYYLPWQAYGYNDGSFNHASSGTGIAFGAMAPLILNIPESLVTQSVTINSFDGNLLDWSGDWAPEPSVIHTTYGTFGHRYLMTIEFPDSSIFTFETRSQSTDEWYEYGSSNFASKLQAYNGQTIEITVSIAVNPASDEELAMHDAINYTSGLAPASVDALYFIDPLTFYVDGEIRAFPDTTHRDMAAPSYTQEVVKPPMLYYPGKYDYVDGVWVKLTT